MKSYELFETLRGLREKYGVVFITASQPTRKNDSGHITFTKNRYLESPSHDIFIIDHCNNIITKSNE